MIRVNKIRFKHFSLLISLLVSNGILFSCSKPDNIQIKTSNDTLISGIQEFSQTTISVESAKQLNMNQTD
jgi:archaellum component FlaF (FlaF/FlaG flagellin family)